jgi:hypothetical protein
VVLAERGQTDEARKVLKPALDASGAFAFRQSARELSDRLNTKP